jgi:hypothetical protein
LLAAGTGVSRTSCFVRSLAKSPAVRFAQVRSGSLTRPTPPRLDWTTFSPGHQVLIGASARF